MATKRKPQGIAARFWAGESPHDLSRERCDRVHCGALFCASCMDCLRAVENAIRRDHAKAVKAGRGR